MAGDETSDESDSEELEEKGTIMMRQDNLLCVRPFLKIIEGNKNESKGAFVW